MNQATTPACPGATAGLAVPPPSTDNLGFQLAKASQRWNELLAARFRREGYAEVRPAYGSILLPLFEENGLRMGELARRARLSKQTMTTMVRLMERDGLVSRRRDPEDGRASLVYLTSRSRDFMPVAGAILAELDGLVLAELGSRRMRDLEAALRAISELGP